MTVITSEARDQAGGRENNARRTITFTGIHKKRMLEVIASNAKPNKRLRDAVAAARATRK